MVILSFLCSSQISIHYLFVHLSSTRNPGNLERNPMTQMELEKTQRTSSAFQLLPLHRIRKVAKDPSG